MNIGINDTDRAAIVELLSHVLADTHGNTSEAARAAFPVADAAGDQVTMDLLTQRLEFHEKTARMLRSLLE